MSEDLSKQQLNIYLNAVDRYIRKGEYWKKKIRERYPLLIAVADIVLNDVLSSIKERTCPYCGSKMRMRSAVVRHILRDHTDVYYNDIRYVVDVYAKLRQRLIRTNKCRNGICTQVFRLQVGDSDILGRQKDIAKEILRNPSILQKLEVL